MSEKKTISVMIPCYNEEQNARPIYEAVRDELVKSCPNYDYEILFIDNKSEDGTRAIIRQICAEDKHVKAIFNVKNFGQFNSPYYGMIHTSGSTDLLPMRNSKIRSWSVPAVPTGEPASIVWPRWAVTVFNPNR